MKTYTFIIVIFLLMRPLYAADGSTYLNYLQFSPSSRGASLGDALISVPNEVDQIFYNPAGVFSDSHLSTSVMYTYSIQDLNYFNMAGKIRVNPYLNVGLGFGTLIYDDVFKVIDVNDTLVRTKDKIGLNDFLFVGHISTKRDSHFSFGLNVKIVNEKLDSMSINKIGFDPGILYTVNQRVNLGATLMNIGIKDLLDLKVGLNHRVNKKDSVTDIFLNGLIDYQKQESLKFSLGLEVFFYKMITARVGYALGQDLGALRFGLGMVYKHFNLDYCFTSYDTLGINHKLGVKFNME